MILQKLTDEGLMRLYQNGSDKAFAVLYERHSPKIYSYLKRRIADKNQMEDIYQNVFVKIHKCKNLYNLSLPLLPWIFTVTRSVMIDEFRKDKSAKLVDTFDFDKLASESLEPIHNVASEAALEAGIEQLSPTQKTALQLRYIDENTFDEIALKLKTSPLNARKIISRGIQRLKQLVTESGDV